MPRSGVQEAPGVSPAPGPERPVPREGTDSRRAGRAVPRPIARALRAGIAPGRAPTPARAVLPRASMILIALVLSAALPVRAPDPGVPRAEAFRTLAVVAAGEPGIEEVQAAAARAAEAPTDVGAVVRRSRVAALLPRLTAEYRHDERSYRVLGMQGSGEVDYVRSSPGSAWVVRATWDLGALVSPPNELASLAAASDRDRRRDDRVRRATALFFERRRLAVALALEPPASALALAQAELELDRITAELDALTGGLLSGGVGR